MSRMSRPKTLTLAAYDSQGVAQENPQRVRWLLQNRGPGIVYLSATQEQTGLTPPLGLRLIAGETFIDDPPCLHLGEIWAYADAANTVVTVMEWV